MIRKETVLKVVDSTGVKSVRCIHVYKNLPYASVGDIIRVSIVSAIPSSKLKKGTVHKAAVVQTKSAVFRQNGIKVLFNQNAVILLDEKLQPVTKRTVDYLAMEVNPEYKNASSNGFKYRADAKGFI